MKRHNREIYSQAYFNDFMERMDALEQQAVQHEFTNIPMYQKAKALQRMLEWTRSYIFDTEEDVGWLTDDDIDVMENQMIEGI